MPKILVIEDEDVLLEGLSEWLRYEQFEVICAASGEAGLKLAAAEFPDLVLCDIILSGMDGYEVLKALRQDEVTRRIPIIFLSGQVSQNEIQKGFAMGANDYLCKPSTRADIVAAIRKQLEKPPGQ